MRTMHETYESTCPEDGCPVPIRSVSDGHNREFRHYHGENLLLAVPVGHLPDDVLDATMGGLSLTMGVIVGRAILAFHQGERGEGGGRGTGPRR